jgi:hypothetical protein
MTREPPRRSLNRWLERPRRPDSGSRDADPAPHLRQAFFRQGERTHDSGAGSRRTSEAAARISAKKVRKVNGSGAMFPRDCRCDERDPERKGLRLGFIATNSVAGSLRRLLQDNQANDASSHVDRRYEEPSPDVVH